MQLFLQNSQNMSFVQTQSSQNSNFSCIYLRYMKIEYSLNSIWFLNKTKAKQQKKDYLFKYYMQETLQHIRKVKIHFLIKKAVLYGFAVYVAGNLPVLGGWNISQALRLNWNHQDYWSAFVEIPIASKTKVMFKYVTGHYDAPHDHEIQWEEGQFDRQLILYGNENTLIIQNVWSANRICLNLLVPKFLIREETEIYLAGGCNSLGNWKSKVKMNKITVESLSQLQIQKAKQNIIIGNYQVYSVALDVQRNLRKFNYYFLKKNGQEWVQDRIPQRVFQIDSASNHHPSCLHVSNCSGNYELLQFPKFLQLYYTRITQNLYIGGCIETCEDVKQLKKKGIQTIIYLSSTQASNGATGRSGPKNLVRLISEQNKISYSSLKIDLSNGQHALEQAKKAVTIVGDLIHSQQKIVYIYCSSGQLLAPLLAALYLYIYCNMPLKKSLQTIKQKHPATLISNQVMEIASQIAELDYLNRQNFDINRRKSHTLLRNQQLIQEDSQE